MDGTLGDIRSTLVNNNIKLVDCHCHIAPPHFPEEQIADVVNEANLANIAAIINVAEEIEDIPEMLKLHSKFPLLRPCLGIHPSKVSSVLRVAKISESQLTDEALVMSKAKELVETLERSIKDNINTIVGIGECGLDFSPVWAPSDLAKLVQRYVLECHVKLGKELGLPLNVHSRSAGKPTIDLLQKSNAEHILMHAFDGRANYALQAVKTLPNCYFSIPASIVRAPSFAELAKQLPIEKICLETDSPALHPVKGPNLQNRPTNLLLALKEVSNIKGMTVEEVGYATTQNAYALFTKANPVQ